MAHKKVKYFDLNNYDITNNEKKFEFLVVGTTQGYFRGLIEEWSPSCNLTIHSAIAARSRGKCNKMSRQKKWHDFINYYSENRIQRFEEPGL